MHSPRRLTFAVGTSLLTASLATLGCSKPHVNTRPPEPPHVNEGPQPDAEQPDAETPSEEPPDEPHVNTVPSTN